MATSFDINELLKKAGEAAGAAGKAVSDAANVVGKAAGDAANAVGKAAGDAVNAIGKGIETQSEKAKAKAQQVIDDAEARRQDHIAKVDIPIAQSILRLLKDSPCVLTDETIAKIKSLFPVPVEQGILWADAEFDLRPSGIVLTDKGVFIKSDVVIFDNPFTKEDDHKTESTLTFVEWEYSEPEFFSLDDSSNRALTVDEKCSKRFVSACKQLSKKTPLESESFEAQASYLVNARDNKAAVVSAAAVLEAEAAVFPEQKAQIINPAGHGEMAEQANTIIDRLNRHNAKVIGGDNAKNGADRRVDGIRIQTKYYQSARGTVESTFDSKTGLYRYIDSATKKPMELEVPKDQYEKALKLFEDKIRQGKVPGVTDPAEAKKLVRPGHLTYKQAVNLTKPGTIESISYDIATGAIICTCAFGISFIAAAFNAYRKTHDLEKSTQAGIAAGVQVFGISFIEHVIVSQIARTSAANAFMAPSQFVVEKLGYGVSQGIVNSLRALSGKGAISGIAATKQLAKILRSNVVTTAITLAVFSVPETYNLANKRISSAQYVKNIASLTGSVLGSAGGAIAAGAAAAKIAGAAGTAVAPGIGTVVGLAGGFAGGAIGSSAIKTVGNILHEDDAVIIGRLFNAYVSCLSVEYMLDEKEFKLLSEDLGKVEPEEFKKLFAEILRSDQQERVIRDFLEPRFEAAIKTREPFALPDVDSVDIALADMLNSQ